MSRKLQTIINEIGGASEMLGTTKIDAECLHEFAELLGSRGGYDIYILECGDYFLSHDSGSTHLVTTDDVNDLSTAEARVVGAAGLASGRKSRGETKGTETK